MTRNILRPMILMLMLCSGIMCQPTTVTPSTYTGKLVLQKACGHLVIQVLDGSIDPGKVDPLWKDSVNDSTYINVFTVANQCTFPDNLAEGDTLSFQLDYNPPPTSPLCDECYVFYPTPPVSNYVRNVHKSK